MNKAPIYQESNEGLCAGSTEDAREIPSLQNTLTLRIGDLSATLECLEARLYPVCSGDAPAPCGENVSELDCCNTEMGSNLSRNIDSVEAIIYRISELNTRVQL